MQNHMQYMEDMEIIESDIMQKVLEETRNYNYNEYKTEDIKRALSSDVCYWFFFSKCKIINLKRNTV